jgi:hypothetical protein
MNILFSKINTQRLLRLTTLVSVKSLLFICLILFIVACQRDNKYTIPREKMALIVADLHVAEGATTFIEGSKKDSVLNIYYQQVFEIQGISKEEFDKNLETMKLDPEEMAKVYKIAADSLEAKMKRVEKF